jgi:TonB family protein
MIVVSLRPAWPRPWRIEWQADQDWNTPRNRALREIQSQEFSQCLGMFIDADDDTSCSLARLAEDPTPANTSAASSAAWRVWASFGVDEAIREVAATGQRGDLMGSVLDACQRVHHSLMTQSLPQVSVGAVRAPALWDLNQLLSRDRPVTLKLDAAAASQVLEAIANSVGLALQQVGAGDTCHMTVEFKGTPLNAALEQIAAQTAIRFEVVDPQTLRVIYPTPLPLKMQDKSVTQPAILTKVEPNYPEDARLAGAQGKVMVHAVVRDDGTVGEIRVDQQDELFPSFIDAATEAVRQWTFRPAMKDGRPVSVDYRVRVDFRHR